MINNFKLALSNYPTGIICIFSKNLKGYYDSIIINSFASVSLKPLLVLWSLDKKSSKFNVFKNSKNHIVVILSGNQKKITKELAFQKDQISKKEFSNILKKSICYFTCSKNKVIKAGDHLTFFLKINKVSQIKKNRPLIYYKKKFLIL
tara:strand:+ start:9764 stop:10207 length:444 start_codon:yes stop_codon:yes gene_type:complete